MTRVYEENTDRLSPTALTLKLVAHYLEHNVFREESRHEMMTSKALTELPTSAILLQIVSAKRDCPACEGTGHVGAYLPSGNNEGNAPWIDPTYPEPCAGCGKGISAELIKSIRKHDKK